MQMHFPHFKNATKYHLIKINLTKQSVELRLAYRSVILEINLSELMLDPILINGLDSLDACQIGICYGRLSRSNKNTNQNVTLKRNSGFLLSCNQGQYKIIYQDRNGDFMILDKLTKQEILKKPLEIIKNPDFIKKFSPSLACYIGLHAGINYEKEKAKNQNANLKQHVKPVLRLVK
jgi:hypothetical protein